MLYFLLLSFLACSPDNIELTQQYPIVYNTHNVNNIVKLYSDDAVFEVAGQFKLIGKNKIRDITKYDSVLNIQMHISNPRASGDTVWFDLSETNDWLRISEIGQANYSVYFIFENGLIKKISASGKGETQQAFQRVFSSLLPWAEENKGQILSEMMPEGRFLYNTENARKTLELLRSWKDRQ